MDAGSKGTRGTGQGHGAPQGRNLDEACRRVRALLAEALRSEALAKYKIGNVIADVERNPGTFGAAAVETIAEELDVSPGFLYGASKVAKQWTLPEVEGLVARTEGQGLPLSWSHLLELGKLRAKVTRRELAEKCIVNAWSVRRLREEVGELAGARDDRGADLADDEGVRAALTEGLRTARKASADFGVLLYALQNRLVGEGVDDALVDDTLQAFEELDARIQATRSCLREAAMSSRRRLRVAPVAQVHGRTGRS